LADAARRDRYAVRPAQTLCHHAHNEMRKARGLVHQHPELPRSDLHRLDIGVGHGG
jgi:hypothetical protein